MQVLDVGRRADAEGTGEEAHEEADGDAVDPELAPRQRLLTDLDVAAEPFGLVHLDVECQSARGEHDACDRAEDGGRHDVGEVGAEIVPDSIVKTIEARATASAVWMGTWKPTVSRAIVTPAPPAPTKPINAPRASMEANSKRIILSDF